MLASQAKVSQTRIEGYSNRDLIQGHGQAAREATTDTLLAGICYATVGVHPCSSKDFDTHPSGPTALFSMLEMLALDAKAAGRATAFGEIGLDYDRLFHAPKETQLKYFTAQLEIAVKVQLPLFLHSRAAHVDFVRVLKGVLGEGLEKLEGRGGLVHSFTGSVEEMRELVGLGLHVGVNGCSMKTEENLEVVREIPLDRLQIETDGPWVSLFPFPLILHPFHPFHPSPFPFPPVKPSCINFSSHILLKSLSRKWKPHISLIY